MFYLYSIPGVTFSSNFLHAVTFLHVLHLDVLKRQIEIETESKNSNILRYGYNAGQPMAIPTYTVLPYCVIYVLCICKCVGVLLQFVIYYPPVVILHGQVLPTHILPV